MGRAFAISCMICFVGCTDDTKLTSEERAILAGYALPAQAPADPSNRFAGDARAAELGHRIFFDTRFSGALAPPNDGATDGSVGVAGTTGKLACVACHQLDAESGGSDHRSRSQTSLGAMFTDHNSPSIINSALWDISLGGWQGWTGRADSLWSIPLFAMEGPPEKYTRLELAHAIFDDPSYKQAYEQVFGPMPNLSNTASFPAAGKPGDATFDGMARADQDAVDRVFSNAGKALEAYMRQLISPSFEPSPFDRMLAGDDAAMTPAALRGAKLFIGKAACDECHRGPMFSDGKFHNLAVPQQGDHVPPIDEGRIGGIALVVADPFNRAGVYSDQADGAHLTNLSTEGPEGAFRTAPLRNIAKTAPYMHDGVYMTLAQVIEHYNRGGAGGGYSGSKDIELQPLLLDDSEILDLTEFLGSLSDGEPRDPTLVACPVTPCP